jgi:hypothetical protein
MRRLLSAAAIAVTLTACSHAPTPSVNQNPVVSAVPFQVAPPPPSATLIATSGSIPNPSGDWTTIESDVSGAFVSVDVSTASRQGNIVRFWQKRVLPMPDQFGSSIYLNYQSMDCVKGTFQFHKDIYLTSDGSLVNQGVGNSAIQLITPGSIGESVFRGVCAAIH